MCHHTDAANDTRTTAYVRARMTMLCPPTHVHPPLVYILASGVDALVISPAATGTLMATAIALALNLPGDTTTLLETRVAMAPILSWLAGLFVSARFLRVTV